MGFIAMVTSDITPPLSLPRYTLVWSVVSFMPFDCMHADGGALGSSWECLVALH